MDPQENPIKNELRANTFALVENKFDEHVILKTCHKLKYSFEYGFLARGMIQLNDVVLPAIIGDVILKKADVSKIIFSGISVARWFFFAVADVASIAALSKNGVYHDIFNDHISYSYLGPCAIDLVGHHKTYGWFYLCTLEIMTNLDASLALYRWVALHIAPFVYQCCHLRFVSELNTCQKCLEQTCRCFEEVSWKIAYYEPQEYDVQNGHTFNAFIAST